MDLSAAPTTEVRVSRAERYQWFLILALLALLGAAAVGVAPARREEAP